MDLHICVTNKKATFVKRYGEIVCGNNDYRLVFTFDEAWDDYTEKTARFIWNGQYFDVEFTGNICAVPVITNTDQCEVGVYAGDLRTTTRAIIPCVKSILCSAVVPNPGTGQHYSNEAKAAADRAETAESNAKNSENQAKASETVAKTSEIIAVNAADRAEAILGNAERTDARISRNDKRITNLEQGLVPDPFEVDASSAYMKIVPTRALPYAEVAKVGGTNAKVTEVRSASANLLRPFNTEPVTENGITMQYLPDEDCYLFNGSLPRNEEVHFYAPYHITTEYRRTLEVGAFYVSGAFDDAGGGAIWIDDDFHEDGGIVGFSADLPTESYYVESGSNIGPSHGEFEVSFYFWGGEGRGTMYLDNYKVRVHFKYAETESTEYAGAYNPNLDSLKIPAEVQALPDYGKTDTYIEWRDDGRFFVTPDGETDISHLLPEDNFIRVEGGGTITAVNEHGLAAPTEIIYQMKEATV